MKSTKKKILAISGSTKSSSTSLFFLKHIAEAYGDILDMEIYNSIASLPHFNPELEDENLPPTVKAFRKKIEIADAVLFCTPEYVFSLPGSLKNAIEWNVSTVLFSKKPVAMIIAAAVGEKAFESLSLIMTTIESVLPDSSKLLIKGAKGKLGENGKIKDATTRDAIEKVIQSMVDSIEFENKMATKYRKNME